MKTAFIFSGQGAQAVGMGKDLCESSEAARAIFAKADEVLGWSISEICFEGPAEKLKESRYCQPAIYTMSVAALEAFKEKEIECDLVATGGLSLGEYAALYAAGVYSFEDGLKLIAKRAEFMHQACEETTGGMASVIAGDAAVIKEVCDENGIQIANYNCPGQIVVSGEKASVKATMKGLKAKGLRAIPLRVAGAFHSKLMSSAGDKLKAVLANTEMSEPKIIAMQNFVGGAVNSIEEIKNNLEQQVAGSVRWEECIEEMRKLGVEKFIEFGPGNVLTGLLKRTDETINSSNVSNKEELANFAM